MRKVVRSLLWLLLVVACAVPNDIPYPVVEARIVSLEVDGQCDASGVTVGTTEIDRAKRTANLFVCDTVNLNALRIVRMDLRAESKNPDVDYKEEPTMRPDPLVCQNAARFPTKSFSNPTNSYNTVVNFSKLVKFTLSTYQDYEWTVSVQQVVNREVEVENQVGNAIIDPITKNVVVYVKATQSLKKLKVHKFSIGGTHGTVYPDPTAVETYDFYNPQTFLVTTGWGESHKWNVMVYQTEAEETTTAQVFARTRNALVSGSMPNGSTPVVEYQEMNESEWRQVPQRDITYTSTSFSAWINNLDAAATYRYRVTAGNSTTEPQTFTTTEMLQMPNFDFDDWSQDAQNNKLWYPWSETDRESYWETGNKGAATVGESNSVPTDDTPDGKGYSACLTSRWIVIKFAAGNIFTGKYLKTDGTNGILGFGRPFTAFPTRLSFDYKYQSEEINRVGDANYNHLKGRPDSCQIYIALWHIEENDYEEYKGEKYPLVIRTRPSEQHLFSPNDRRIVAYAEFSQGDDVMDWTHHSLELRYRDNTRIPTHIQVVAASSKYGDFFTGGEGSCLVLDNLKLHYD